MRNQPRTAENFDSMSGEESIASSRLGLFICKEWSPATGADLVES
jgi:hypothetical protein